MGCNRINHERDFVGAASKQKRVLPRARPQHSSYQLSPHQRNSSQLLIQCQNSSTAAFHIARALRPTKAELTPQKMKRMCKQMKSFMFFCLNIKKKKRRQWEHRCNTKYIKDYPCSHLPRIFSSSVLEMKSDHFVSAVISNKMNGSVSLCLTKCTAPNCKPARNSIKMSELICRAWKDKYCK